MEIFSLHLKESLHSRRSRNRSSIPGRNYLLKKKSPYSPFKTNQIPT